ncbi:MAG: hypothetical protein K2M92_02505, partial [Bacteroidales bacterium]|nr:hypothetical protein [Bacteroidales bacterium]
PEIYAQLKALADYLKDYAPDPEKEKRPYLPPEQIFVTEIRYEGLKKYNENFIHQSLQVEVNKWNKLDDILEGINRVYGTNVFSSVTYELKQDPDRLDGTILVVRLEESPVNSFKVGVRYDNDRSAALLAGVKFRNLGFRNSALTVDVELSRMVAARVDYSVRPNWSRHKKGYSLWTPSANVSFEYYRVSSYLYRDPDDFRIQTSEVRSNRYKVRLYGQSNWKLNVLGGGIGYEYAFNKEFSSDSPLRNDVFNNSYVFPYLYFKHNSYNAKILSYQGFEDESGGEPAREGGAGRRQAECRAFVPERLLDIRFRYRHRQAFCALSRLHARGHSLQQRKEHSHSATVLPRQLRRYFRLVSFGSAGRAAGAIERLRTHQCASYRTNHALQESVSEPARGHRQGGI